MEPTPTPDSSVYRILYFEEVYPSRAAEEQAEKASSPPSAPLPGSTR